MKTFDHRIKTRERVSANSNAKKPMTARQKRRAEQRETRNEMAANVQHDSRAVKFHF